jgi:hypothetical protein
MPEACTYKLPKHKRGIFDTLSSSLDSHSGSIMALAAIRSKEVDGKADHFCAQRAV